MPTWWQDDCTCPVVDTSGDGCGLTTDTDEPTHLCRHCKAHAAGSAMTDNGARALAERLAVHDLMGDGECARNPDAHRMCLTQADAILANGAVFLPDAAELDRLREQNDGLYLAVQMGAKEQDRLRAALGEVQLVIGKPSTGMHSCWGTAQLAQVRNALRALQPEGSARDGG